MYLNRRRASATVAASRSTIRSVGRHGAVKEKHIFRFCSVYSIFDKFCRWCCGESRSGATATEDSMSYPAM